MKRAFSVQQVALKDLICTRDGQRSYTVDGNAVDIGTTQKYYFVKQFQLISILYRRFASRFNFVDFIRHNSHDVHTKKI
jgi:hypothetical protein